MDAPAEQTMQGKDNVPDNDGWTAYEIGICEFWKEPLGFLCSMICLPCCAVYQDYAEVKLRMNRRWAERLAEDHPNGDEMTS